jgi:hypothetical protein
MKLIFSVVLTFTTILSLAQTNSTGKLKLESISINTSTERLYHGQQNFSDFSTTIADDFLFPVDSGAREFHPVNSYSYRAYSVEAGFQIEGSKWRLITGATYNQRLERDYMFQLRNETIIDTVYTPVPYGAQADPEYPGGVYYDTLLLDSTSMNELIVKSNTKNVFVHAEIIRDFKKNKYTFSSGIGLALGVSVKNEVTSTYTNYWGLTMNKIEMYSPGYPYWFAFIPRFDPQGGGPINPSEFVAFKSDSNRLKGNTIFTVKPYIPIRVEAVIAEKGFFSKVGVMGSANAGVEFQIVKNDGIRSRFFWNYKAGIFVRI